MASCCRLLRPPARAAPGRRLAERATHCLRSAPPVAFILNPRRSTRPGPAPPTRRGSSVQQRAICRLCTLAAWPRPRRSLVRHARGMGGSLWWAGLEQLNDGVSTPCRPPDWRTPMHQDGGAGAAGARRLVRGAVAHPACSTPTKPLTAAPPHPKRRSSSRRDPPRAGACLQGACKAGGGAPPPPPAGARRARLPTATLIRSLLFIAAARSGFTSWLPQAHGPPPAPRLPCSLLAGAGALAGSARAARADDAAGVASSRMSYSRFLEYLEMGRVKKVRAGWGDGSCGRVEWAQNCWPGEGAHLWGPRVPAPSVSLWLAGRSQPGRVGQRCT